MRETRMNPDRDRAAGEAGGQGKRAVLVVSFGTSYRDSIEADIGSVERAIASSFPDYEVRRAFTSRMIIGKLLERDGVRIDYVDEAMDRLLRDGIGTVVVQPTHVMNGYEYDAMIEAVRPYENQFASIRYGRPLLSDGRDYDRLASVLMEETARYDDGRTAVVYMGHGTEHAANVVYERLYACLRQAGQDHLYVGTVEALPSLEDTVARVRKGSYGRVVLIPLMIVAGDHAYHDMAGDEKTSWKGRFRDAGYEVECVLKGIGQCLGVQELFADHIRDALGPCIDPSMPDAEQRRSVL